MENKWKQWISGFGKKGKLPAKQQLLILLLAGILLVVVVPGSGSERSGNRDRGGTGRNGNRRGRGDRTTV